MHQEVTLWAVDVERLGAVFTAAGLLSSPDVVYRWISRRGVSLRRAGRCRLGQDAWGEFNCVWDDGIATLQWMPEGDVGGFRGRGGAAEHRGGGASRGEVGQRDTSARDHSLGQVWWFGWTNWLASPQLGATSSCFVTEQTSQPITITGPDLQALSREQKSAAARPADSRSSERLQSPGSPGLNRAAPFLAVGRPDPLSPV